MLRRKNDFKPDREDSGTLNKLYITPKQRMAILKWVLFGICLVALSLIQDVIMSGVSIFGATTDLVPLAILLICLLIEVDSSALFALISSLFFVLSGSAPGVYSIVLLTFLGVLLNIFRHSYLRRGFPSAFLCAGVALMIYELLVFLMGVFLGNTTFARFGIFCLTGGIDLLVMPVLYPIFLSISKIGGESWKE